MNTIERYLENFKSFNVEVEYDDRNKKLSFSPSSAQLEDAASIVGIVNDLIKNTDVHISTLCIKELIYDDSGWANLASGFLTLNVENIDFTGSSAHEDKGLISRTIEDALRSGIGNVKRLTVDAEENIDRGEFCNIIESLVKTPIKELVLVDASIDHSFEERESDEGLIFSKLDEVMSDLEARIPMGQLERVTMINIFDIEGERVLPSGLSDLYDSLRGVISGGDAQYQDILEMDDKSLAGWTVLNFHNFEELRELFKDNRRQNEENRVMAQKGGFGGRSAAGAAAKGSVEGFGIRYGGGGAPPPPKDDRVPRPSVARSGDVIETRGLGYHGGYGEGAGRQ